MENVQTKQNIEVELRALMNEEQFFKLTAFFDKNCEDLGKDNKDTYFYLFPDKLLKVTNNITKKNAKITLKLQKIGLGDDFEEIEANFLQEDVQKIIRILGILGLKEHQYSYQNRHNYFCEDVEFAMKYTVSWGFHCEMEIMVESKNDIPRAVKQITKVASDLGLKIMTNEELKEFTSKINAGWGRGQYSREEFENKYS